MDASSYTLPSAPKPVRAATKSLLLSSIHSQADEEVRNCLSGFNDISIERPQSTQSVDSSIESDIGFHPIIRPVTPPSLSAASKMALRLKWCSLRHGNHNGSSSRRSAPYSRPISPFDTSSQSPTQQLIKRSNSFSIDPIHSTDFFEDSFSYRCKLPTLTQSEFGMGKSLHVGMNVVSCQTAANVILGNEGSYEQVIVVDCRFKYEYQGGHIQDAVHLESPLKLEDFFFDRPSNLGDKVCILFHCEFSQSRGPKLCRALREFDRKIHGIQHFPNLYYPEVYLIDGGYKDFFSLYPELCSPRSYTPMSDMNFIDECREAKARLRKDEKEFKFYLFRKFGSPSISPSISPYVASGSPDDHENNNEVITRSRPTKVDNPRRPKSAVRLFSDL